MKFLPLRWFTLRALPNLHGLPEYLLRQAKLWKGECHELKPFVAIQRVRLPPGKGAARQPEASLAWRAATRVVKRRQQVTKRRGKPRNRQSMTPSLLNVWGQYRKRRYRRGATGRPGSWTGAESRDGSPGNLGDPAPARGQGRWKGDASMQIQTPARCRACTAAGALYGEHEPGRRPRSRLAKTISRRTCKGRKS